MKFFRHDDSEKSYKDRICGGFWGLLIGDALGVPYEFCPAKELPPKRKIEYCPPSGFNRSHSSVLPGTWSDDGAQALCLLDSLLECNSFNLDNFAQKLLSWYDSGLWAVNNRVFDVGIQTQKALEAFSYGMDAQLTGNVVPDGKGNGSLMRVLPLALWHRGSDTELVDHAHAQSCITHGHITNQICCALYCLWARRLLKGIDIDSAYLDAVITLQNIYKDRQEYSEDLNNTVQPLREAEGKGSGYVVDSLHSVRVVMSRNSFEDVVKGAVTLGDDTDTTAALAGGLAGIRFGVNGIPKRWLEGLRGFDMANALLVSFLNEKDINLNINIQ